MRLIDILQSALRGVTSNKLRSVLTLLGVLIGVASVILLMAVGNGSAAKIRAAITSLGTNTITVRANGGSSTTGSSAITLAVSKQLEAAGLGHVTNVVPQATTSLTVSSAGASEDAISIIGTSADYFTVSTATVASGSAFTADDVASAAKVAVIGSTLATELFPSASALGQSISIDGTPFTVVGILATQSSVGFTDPNTEVIAPISRIQRSYTGFGAVSSLLVQAKDSDSVTAAEGEVTVELNQLLGVSSTAATSASASGSGRTSGLASQVSATSPFTVTDQSSLLQTQAESADSFTALLAAVAAISLLVGGIGVTNVMLVTVTERTREIGIRKALGATRGAILGQFLAEAATLTLVGGILGVIIALVLAQYPFNGTQPVVIGYSIPLALGVSVAIGVFFGVYPAARAAGMRPIQALRSI
ncbi:MAG: macrolide transporter permease [Glaciihabitans sp.]|jgi:putative ABC transport system permease protein|nr:macrolide transporter permease [Glaciihabitans sp.]MDQ1571627.1 putative transport system permease protein [Actinomycetota bacterium]